ncbi:hypothetical protein CISECK363B_11145 [Citrobacter sedlakii]
MTHRAQVIHFIRLHFLQDTGQVGRVRQVTVMQMEFGVAGVRILINMINTFRVKRRGTTLNTVHFIPFFQ